MWGELNSIFCLINFDLTVTGVALYIGDLSFHSQAVASLQKCLEEAPHCTAFRSKLAEALVFMRDYNEAQIIAKYLVSHLHALHLQFLLFFPSDLLKSDSNNATALYVKAMCCYYQDIPDRATQFFHAALRVDPDHTKSKLALKVHPCHYVVVDGI